MALRSGLRLVFAQCGLLALIGLPVNATEPPPPPQALRADYQTRHVEPLVLEFDDVTLISSSDVKVISIPESVRRLDGRRVQIRGFMLPPPVEQGSPAFLAIPEVQQENRIRPRSEHCSGGKLRTRDRVEPVRYSVPVLLENGETIDWTPDRDRKPLVIEGTLRHQSTMNLEFDRCPFWIEEATCVEAEPRQGYGALWPVWPGC